jgi:hypothetical protein
MNIPLPHKNLAALLQVENDNELLEYSCPETGLPVWPLIRVEVLRAIMSDWSYNSTPLLSFSKNRNFRKLAKDTALSAMHNFTYNVERHRDILIQSTGLGSYVNEGITRDRLVGYFSEAMPERTIVYQDKPKEHLRQRYSFEPVMYSSPRNIIHKIYSHIAVNTKVKKLARHVIEHVKRNASEQLDYTFESDLVQSLINSLSKRIASLPFATDAYSSWFSKWGFKLLLKEDACYGGNRVPVIYAAKLNNIPVAEYQHGAISRGHDAYNVADALLANTTFHKVLPDYLLTYGNWWSKQTNLPIKKIAIGNPHLTESTSGIMRPSMPRNKVLILGDGIETDLYLELASRCYSFVDYQGLSVVFRPHPLERDRVRNMELPRGVTLDAHPDIYPSFMESRVVISELSTGLFEAVGLSDVVLLWETEKSKFAFPVIPFKSFSSFDELKTILKFDSTYTVDSISIPDSELWEPNWKQNYNDFVESIVSL